LVDWLSIIGLIIGSKHNNRSCWLVSGFWLRSGLDPDPGLRTGHVGLHGFELGQKLDLMSQ
jgi:hypothetical protein